jgi:hypothetical protein
VLVGGRRLCSGARNLVDAGGGLGSQHPRAIAERRGAAGGEQERGDGEPGERDQEEEEKKQGHGRIPMFVDRFYAL